MLVEQDGNEGEKPFNWKLLIRFSVEEILNAQRIFGSLEFFPSARFSFFLTLRRNEEDEAAWKNVHTINLNLIQIAFAIMPSHHT